MKVAIVVLEVRLIPAMFEDQARQLGCFRAGHRIHTDARKSHLGGYAVISFRHSQFECSKLNCYISYFF